MAIQSDSAPTAAASAEAAALFDTARGLLRGFKGDAYVHGLDVLPRVGPAARRLGSRGLLVADRFPGSEAYLGQIRDSLARAGVQVAAELDGARANAPREDVDRIRRGLDETDPEFVISFGGGSTIDATKAAEVLATAGGAVDDYFGTGLVTQRLAGTGKRLRGHVAIQTAASSGAHLTKYSNITDLATGQKKLIVDEGIVPAQPVFDYAVTFGAPRVLTADGALDGVSHALEVLFSAVGKPNYALVEQVSATAINLIVRCLPVSLERPQDAAAREGLGLATDLGGYSITIGGTNGAHLTSFSLVDILSHGRACAIMNPYYTVLFAPAIQRPLAVVGRIYEDAGYAPAGTSQLQSRDLGVAVASAMITFEQRIGFPTRLADVPGFTAGHIDRALAAAKNPQLKSKLENMPVPLSADTVDEYMGPVLQAAETGDLEMVRSIG
jgi:alcohol dehydrogenase